MKHLSEIYKNVLMLSQLGLSFITPLLLCLALCWWLTARAGVGFWVYVPGFILGLGSSAMVAYKFYLAMLKKEEKEKRAKKERVSYNRHL